MEGKNREEGSSKMLVLEKEEIPTSHTKKLANPDLISANKGTVNGAKTKGGKEGTKERGRKNRDGKGQRIAKKGNRKDSEKLKKS